MGVYTMVYSGVVYAYASSESSGMPRCIVLGMISALYFLSSSTLVLLWNKLNWTFISRGDTRDSLSYATLEPVSWFDTGLTCVLSMSFVISDALLIWRCYYVWGRRLKVTFVLFMLLTAEFAFAVISTVIHAVHVTYSNIVVATLSNSVIIALFLSSTVTTVSTTILIGYKIHNASHASTSHARKTMRMRYAHILSTIVESSAAYSVVLAIFGVSTIIAVLYRIPPNVNEALSYIQPFVFILSGLAPTVMALRLAVSNANMVDSSGTITHISGVQSDHSPPDDLMGTSSGPITTHSTANVQPVLFVQI
uniref:Uncharacterized protein n=1 Tax=Psilocybe cubensis TaxID=181762 RepID=A0A8H7XJJ3_PSICU